MSKNKIVTIGVLYLVTNTILNEVAHQKAKRKMKTRNAAHKQTRALQLASQKVAHRVNRGLVPDEPDAIINDFDFEVIVAQY